MKGDISFIQNGNIFRFNDNSANQVHPTLPVGNYIIRTDQFGNMFLEKADSFPLHKKLYGNVVKHSKRILNTFHDRESGTGVLLSGEKGSGKTLLAKQIVIDGATQGIPTLIINHPYAGDAFNKFIQNIAQPAILLFDEFEKVYDHDTQEQMLTLLDGVYSGRKLFILTCNDRWRIDTHMRNRPGRIYYYFDFRGLEEEFIREYCRDNLNNKSHIDTLANIAGVFSAFNFDMLKACVEEMNRYDESPQEALRVLNVRAEFDSGTAYDVKIYRGDEEANRISPQLWTGTPLAKDDLEFSFHIQNPNERANRVRNSVPEPVLTCADDEAEMEDDKEYGWLEIDLKPADLVKLDTKTEIGRAHV